jgi:hypothetical protein
MKILVAAKVLRLDRTAEGICTSKFLMALVRAGHRVTCVTNDALDTVEGVPAAGWLPSVRIVPLSAVSSGFHESRFARLRQRGRSGVFVAQKLNAAQAYMTGYDGDQWAEVSQWEMGIGRLIARDQPDVVVTRGAGIALEPHIALTRSRLPVPWIAHYHDPYPISRFPEPYRHTFRFLSTRQEAVHAQILEAADALTFPCMRLMRWVLCGDLERYRQKAFVVPHVAMDLPTAVGSAARVRDTADQRVFEVAHTGSLLRQRDPRALLDGFLEFVKGLGRDARSARLVFVGKINQAHHGCSAWQELEERGNLTRIETRVPYADALTRVRGAAGLALVEAQAEESPVMLAKLADYLWLRRPILALSPRASGTADILGSDYPLLVSPTDARQVSAALRLLWSHWSDGTLDRLVPPDKVLQPVTEGPVQATIAAACHCAQAAHRRRRKAA